MALRIREAKLEDAAALAVVHVAAWQAGYEGQMPADFLAGLGDDLDTRTEQWRVRLRPQANLVHLLAEDDENGELYGFISVGYSRDEGTPETIGEVWAINLHPRAWGRGIGSALFRAGVAGLRDLGYENAVLWVLATNARARRFYERHGWQADGHTKVDPRDGFELHEVRYGIPLG